MDMDDYSGPTVAVLVRELLGAGSVREVDSVHPDRGEAARWLGQMLMDGTAPAGTASWSLVIVPAPSLADYDAGQPVEHEPLQDQSGSGQQRGAELAAALDVAIGEMSWSAMCRKVRALRQAEDERGTGGPELGAQLWAALEPTGISEGADEADMVARVRELAEAANTPAVDPLADPDRAADLRARLVRELDPDLPANAERLDRAADALSDYRGTPANEATAAIVDAYLREG